MPEQVIAPTTQPTSAPDQRNPKSVAQSITQSIQKRSNGTAPVDTTPTEKQPAEVTPVDPNAGKEKFTVDGKDIWLSPEQARAYAQKGIAFEPKVTQLGHLQHEMNAFMQTLSRDPLKILTDKRIGLTPEAVLEKIFQSEGIADQVKERVGKWYWDNVVQVERMTPEQREIMEKTKKLSQYEQREKLEKENSLKRENEFRVQQALGQIKANIGEAMKESGLPDNDSPLGTMMARRIADKMRLAYFQRQTLTPKAAIEQVKSELKLFQTAYYDNLDDENLVKEIGEKNAEKVKKYYLKLAKENEKQPTVQRAPSTNRVGERKTISQDEFHDYLAELKKKG